MASENLIELRLWMRNDRILHAKKGHGYNMEILSLATSLSVGKLRDIINLRFIPSDDERKIISAALDEPWEWLFSPQLDEIIRKHIFLPRIKLLNEIEAMQLGASILSLPSYCPNEDIEKGIDLQSLRIELKSILDNKINPRERRVLQLRFGLEDGRARTLEEVGKEFNVTRERIRQIEIKALRKLRHPSRSRKLRDYY